MKNEGIFKGLVEQVERIANHNNQGSYKTRQRYYEAVKRFICRQNTTVDYSAIVLSDRHSAQQIEIAPGRRSSTDELHQDDDVPALCDIREASSGRNHF